ncbi:uncharacterized protein LOC143690924 [Tamandua tetradactyla]|uniref:uncharacterized protein LOC143690924 n=1 Tax=Tamandua tetradactyla TaxID=48850 RepID=UPI0040543376
MGSPLQSYSEGSACSFVAVLTMGPSQGTQVSWFHSGEREATDNSSGFPRTSKTHQDGMNIYGASVGSLLENLPLYQQESTMAWVLCALHETTTSQMTQCRRDF